MEVLDLLMKGGKDMKKTYKFEEEKEKYIIMDDKDEIFIINKDNLKIDGNKFYEAFFDNYSIGDSIELQKGESVNDKDKLSIATYDTLKQLIDDIIKKIEEKKEEQN